MINKPKKILVTGCSGFIGFHLCRLLLNNNEEVFGVDGMTDYYDINLKINRLNQLTKYENFIYVKGMLEQKGFIQNICKDFKPDVCIHLAAQAGVRYSIENPITYAESNLLGTFHVLEAVRNCDINHLLAASSSSVYGSNKEMPFKETDKCDTQLSFYAATKKANEVMCHSYSHLYSIPVTMLRFFTVYGPWGRPDMALFKFTDLIQRNKEINIYNNGMMKRDFTYISDIVNAINHLIDVVPDMPSKRKDKIPNDSLSDVAPWRVINIGSSNPIELMDFVDTIGNYLNLKVKKKFMPLQSGDVEKTWANVDLLKHLVNFKNQITVEQGVKSFIDWYINYNKGCFNDIK